MYSFGYNIPFDNLNKTRQRIQSIPNDIRRNYQSMQTITLLIKWHANVAGCGAWNKSLIRWHANVAGCGAWNGGSMQHANWNASALLENL